MGLLAEILSSKVRAEVFRILFGGASGTSLHMREIERRSGYAIGTVQTELKKLQRLAIISREKDGNRVYYSANTAHPLYPDIRSLVLKTSGMADAIRDLLAAEKDIRIAFLFGSLARQEETWASDVDLMVIGNLGLRKLTDLLIDASKKVDREINPHVFTEKEYARRKTEGDHFLTRVLDSPKIFIIGSDNELAAMA